MTAGVDLAATPAPAKPVGAVIAALGILRCLGRHAEPLRLLDIAREEGLNGSTALNILRTLDHERLVAFDRRTKRYALAGGLADLAAPVLDRRDAGRRAAQAMAAAAHELDATVGLWRIVGDEVELIQVAEAASAMRIAFTIGRRLPMFLGAMGRLVAARGDWSEAELERRFAAVRWAKAPDYDAWRAELDAVRSREAATDAGFVNLGVLGVAVPVERDGRLARLVSAATFAADPPADADPIIERLRTVAAAIA